MDSSSTKAGAKQARKKGGGIGETLLTIFYAGLIAIGVRTFAYEPFNIPSGSMLPTLLIGDYLFVSKFSYGYSRYSLPLGMPLIRGRLFEGRPERGDVAVFKLPTDNSTDYIKRIIGLPGDRIQVLSGILHINDKPVQRRRIGEFVHVDDYGNAYTFVRYIETLPGGREHEIIERSDDGPLDNTLVYEVPPGHYFAMGDNRDNSQDSRVLNAVGFVPAENLVGRAVVLFFSSDGSARFWEVWKWPVSIRFGRLLNGIR
jgi:signal peptidase I